MPASIPDITTKRLVLRAFVDADVPAVVDLAGDARIAATTLRIPHPYTVDDARAWLGTHAARAAEGGAIDLAVTLREGGALVGSIGLEIAAKHGHAEMGYWIGVPYWGKGYATEAARAVLAHALGPLGLHRVHAHHFASNPASGRVLEKIGMRREGELREHVRKDGRFETLAVYGVLSGEQ